MKFEILGNPQSKQRPRVINKCNRTWTYTPIETSLYESLVKDSYIRSGGKRYEEPISINIRFYYEPPKSWSDRKKRLAILGQIKKITRPDIDNLTKTILDALNGVAYDDDSQIVHLEVSKEYDHEAKTEVEVKGV